MYKTLRANTVYCQYTWNLYYVVRRCYEVEFKVVRLKSLKQMVRDGIGINTE